MNPDTPRRHRDERREWQAGAALCRRLPYHLGAIARRRPYLDAHPEREIAEATSIRFPGLADCAACGVTYRSRVNLTVTQAIAAAWDWVHRHNAERHPRRYRRSQGLDR